MSPCSLRMPMVVAPNLEALHGDAIVPEWSRRNLVTLPGELMKISWKTPGILIPRTCRNPVIMNQTLIDGTAKQKHSLFSLKAHSYEIKRQSKTISMLEEKCLQSRVEEQQGQRRLWRSIPETFTSNGESLASKSTGHLRYGKRKGSEDVVKLMRSVMGKHVCQGYSISGRRSSLARGTVSNVENIYSKFYKNNLLEINYKYQLSIRPSTSFIKFICFISIAKIYLLCWLTLDYVFSAGAATISIFSVFAPDKM